MKQWLLPAILLLSVETAIAHPCNNVLSEAAQQTDAQLALALLGGCLASSAESTVHLPVVLEMAKISLRVGEYDHTARYLEILSDMLTVDSAEDDQPQYQHNTNTR